MGINSHQVLSPKLSPQSPDQAPTGLLASHQWCPELSLQQFSRISKLLVCWNLPCRFLHRRWSYCQFARLPGRSSYGFPCARTKPWKKQSKANLRIFFCVISKKTFHLVSLCVNSLCNHLWSSLTSNLNIARNANAVPCVSLLKNENECWDWCS